MNRVTDKELQILRGTKGEIDAIERVLLLKKQSFFQALELIGDRYGVDIVNGKAEIAETGEIREIVGESTPQENEQELLKG